MYIYISSSSYNHQAVQICKYESFDVYATSLTPL